MSASPDAIICIGLLLLAAGLVGWEIGYAAGKGVR